VAGAISRAEVVGALSIATDMAMGQPLGSGLRICLTALELAERAGAQADLRARVYYVALLRHVGCTAESDSFASLVGDEVAFRGAASTLDLSTPRVLMPYMLRHLVRTNGLVGAAGKLMQMAAERDRLQEGVLAVCEVAELLAERLGLDAGVQSDLLLVNERWDGKSFLKRARGKACRSRCGPCSSRSAPPSTTPWAASRPPWRWGAAAPGTRSTPSWPGCSPATRRSSWRGPRGTLPGRPSRRPPRPTARRSARAAWMPPWARWASSPT
jgi:hypothetical protein